MTQHALDQDVDRVCDLVEARSSREARSLIAIAGPPGSGKSTLAQRVADQLNQNGSTAFPRAAVLPMDGYHLDNSLLEARGLLARKGAPETFDAQGFCAAVQRLTQKTAHETLHPRFDRRRDLALANAIAIHPRTPLIVVEGNYLLLRAQPWVCLRQVFAAMVFICPPLAVLRVRLQQRWVEQGLDPGAATVRVDQNDLPNAELVLSQSLDADMRLDQSPPLVTERDI